MECRQVSKGDQLLTTAETAKLMGFTQKALEGMRLRGDGPPYVKIGRSVRYRYKDLVEFIKQRTRT